MKHWVALLFICITMGTTAQPITVATFNIRYASVNDTGNLWKDRKQYVADLIRYHRFELFGVQEALKLQLDDLRQSLPEFVHYGVGRDDGRDKGEHSSIFYSVERFELLDQGDFWLSPTPDRPGPGWDANLNRICSWVKLKDRLSKKTFFVFNAHYDHQGIKARIESSKLVLEKIKAIAGKSPAIFMGDLNGNRESEWYRTLSGSLWLTDTYTQVALPYEPNGSFNGFKTTDVRKDVIDHVFVTEQFTAPRWGVLTDTYNGTFPSDHFPVAVTLRMQ